MMLIKLKKLKFGVIYSLNKFRQIYAWLRTRIRKLICFKIDLFLCLFALDGSVGQFAILAETLCLVLLKMKVLSHKADIVYNAQIWKSIVNVMIVCFHIARAIIYLFFIGSMGTFWNILILLQSELAWWGIRHKIWSGGFGRFW